MPEKKRTRPTWEQVRKLEAEIAELKTRGVSNESKELAKKLEEQMEGTSALVKECDVWREKYRKLAEEKEDLEKRHQKLKIDADNAEYDLDRSVPADKYLDLEKKYKILETSNGHMEKEMKRINKENDRLSKKCIDRGDELAFLKTRGFWARVFNKMYVPED